MILYHGSTIDIEKIDLALSKPNKDFGRAFVAVGTGTWVWVPVFMAIFLLYS